MFPPPAKKTFCSICNNEVDTFDQKVALERHIVHKECFRCGICDVQLNQGSCSFDHILYRHYGPMWFCPAHKMLGSGEKLELLKAKYGEPKGLKQ
uniref:LIM zinc-binding domain-containing protein n=1 Tax=Meloidogyne floridensis TaxID=298350 RepID=A0A915NH86_9BILA